MQMRENGKHNNFGFNTWLEILAQEHLPPKLRLERERRLKNQREGNEEKSQGKETTEQREHRLAQQTAIL